MFALPLAFLNVGPFECAIFAVIALLLFGGDLPDVARTWGKYFAEIRRHVHGIREEFNSALYAEPDPAPRLPYRPPTKQEPAKSEVIATVEAPSARATDEESSAKTQAPDGETASAESMST